MRRTILVVLVALTALSPMVSAQDPDPLRQRGAGQRFEILPSISITSVYDDNLNAEVESTAGKMLQFRPNLEASFQSPRITFLSVYSQDMLRSNFETLNTVDARRHAFLDMRFRSSPLTTFGLEGRYDRSETPGEIEFETGILGARQTAQRWQISPTFIALS